MQPNQSAAAAGNSNLIPPTKYGCKHVSNQSQLIQVQSSAVNTPEIADFELNVIFLKLLFINHICMRVRWHHHWMHNE